MTRGLQQQRNIRIEDESEFLEQQSDEVAIESNLIPRRGNAPDALAGNENDALAGNGNDALGGDGNDGTLIIFMHFF